MSRLDYNWRPPTAVEAKSRWGVSMIVLAALAAIPIIAGLLH